MELPPGLDVPRELGQVSGVNKTSSPPTHEAPPGLNQEQTSEQISGPNSASLEGNYQRQLQDQLRQSEVLARTPAHAGAGEGPAPAAAGTLKRNQLDPENEVSMDQPPSKRSRANEYRNDAEEIGDVVQAAETEPASGSSRFRLTESVLTDLEALASRDVDKIAQCTSLEEAHGAICHAIEKKFFSLGGITQFDLGSAHKILSSDGLANLSGLKAADSRHICSVVASLHEAVEKVKNTRLQQLKDQAGRADDDDHQINPGLSEIAILSSKAGEKTWLLKFIRADDQKGATRISSEGQLHREVVAHLLNEKNEFPIPLALIMNFKGQLCSVHQFINGRAGLMAMERQPSGTDSSDEDELGLEGGDPYLPMDGDAFSRLLLFDLLFSNGDRHDGNLIFARKPGDAEEYTVFGIDHGDCMSPHRGDRLKIDYLSLPCFNAPLTQDCRQLATEQREERYAEIMAEQRISGSPIEWMRFVCQCLRNSNPLLTARQLANTLLYLEDSFRVSGKALESERFIKIQNIVMEENLFVGELGSKGDLQKLKELDKQKD